MTRLTVRTPKERVSGSSHSPERHAAYLCTPWSHGYHMAFFAGGARDRAKLAPTKTLAMVRDINSGRGVDVPARQHDDLQFPLGLVRY